MNNSLLFDEHGRVARYLRLSVTDHCNLRCSYCRSGVADNFIPHDSILRYEEMLTVVAAAARMGIQKIRLTGGEPFARRGFMDFVGILHERFPQLDLRITTNATLVRPHVRQLKELGIKAMNISLDSFTHETFARVTGKNLLDEVLLTIEDLLTADIGVKINAVAMRGVSDMEMQHFVRFAKEKPVDVRFIEFMPMGADTSWSEALYLPAAELLRLAGQFATITPFEATQSSKKTAPHQGPARMYNIEGGKGRLGIISALSNHFCHSCNRLRVTSDGQLRTCLFADSEHDLRSILRNEDICPHEDANQREECLEQALCQIFAKAIKDKPLGEVLLKARNARAVAQKNMVSIGG